jgi:hypothetical protein
MYDYRIAFQAQDNLETLEEKIVLAANQVDAINNLNRQLNDKGRVLDFVFSVVRMVD